MNTLTISPDVRDEAKVVLGEELESKIFETFTVELSKVNAMNNKFENLSLEEKINVLETASTLENSLESEFEKFGAAGYDFELQGLSFEASLIYKGPWVMISKVDKTTWNKEDNRPETFFGIAKRGEESKLIKFPEPIQDDYNKAKKTALDLISKLG